MEKDGQYLLRANERIDDLQRDGLRIIQNREGFCFGIDAVLLSDFVSVKKNASVLDIGTGTGILPILLSAKSSARSIIGIDIMEDMIEMARRSVAINGLEDLIQMECMDLKQAPEQLGRARFDTIVCNPPYSKSNGGESSKAPLKAAARHEIECTLRDVVESAAKMLNDRGKAAFVLHSGRFFELMLLMHHYGIEPKRVRLVHSYIDRPPKLVLVEGIKGGHPHVQWMAPLVIHQADGSITTEIHQIYHGRKI